MKDRESLYPGRVQLTPVPGQPNLFDLIRADQPTEPGTMINTANLFRDSTAIALGLPTTAVPDDGFAALTPRFGTCTTAAGTVAKMATVAGFKLFTGATVSIRFTNDNTATTPTLNVNGTGAAPMYSAKTQSHIARNDFLAAETTDWVYNGAQWVLLSGKPNGKRLVATFTSSGTFYPADYGLRGKEIDVYMVGGGASGRGGTSGGGGGGGECILLTNIPATEAAYPIVIGVGGAAVVGGGTNGGNTTALGRTALGGSFSNASYNHISSGGDGSSGGGTASAPGGSNGSFGGSISSSVAPGAGKGAGIYCPRNPYNGQLFGGGGGGGGAQPAAPGGDGGGGNGASFSGLNIIAGTPGAPNTGGGGGGAVNNQGSASGGSGIVLIYA